MDSSDHHPHRHNPCPHYRVFQKKVPTFVLLISWLPKHLYIFQQPSLCRIQKWLYFYSRIKIVKAIDKNVVRILHLKLWVLRFQPIWWRTSIFTFFRLPRHLRKGFYTIFNSPRCAESKNDKICIIELK